MFKNKLNGKSFLKPNSIKLGTLVAILTIILITFTCVVLTLYILLSTNNLRGSYENDIENLKSKFVSIITSTIERELKHNNIKSANKTIEMLKTTNILSYAKLVKEDNENNILNKDELPANVGVNDIRFITVDKYTLYFAFTQSNKSDTNNLDFLKTVGIILVGFLLLSTWLAFVLSGFISEPLKKLSEAAKRITEGNFDIKINRSNFTEINELIYTYNEMAFQLNELYSSLELKVQERTIALEAANYKLQETQAMMVHSEKMRSLGELVAGIAHEINNPVNFIHGNIMIMQNYADDLIKLIEAYETNDENMPEELKKKIEQIKKEIDLDFLKTDIKDLIGSCIEGTQRTKNIVLDLKNFSRMEEMVLTQFDIPKEIDTTLNILNNKYKNRITVIKNYASDLPKIEAFGGQLNQVFMNILDNAQDAMGDNGTLTINAFREHQKVRIEFIDNGKGIPQENLKKVFDPFFTTKAVGKGTGLGMSISYRVINDHNGTINVESEVGKGTKFIIVLPINHEDANKISMEDEIIRDLREENGVDDVIR